MSGYWYPDENDQLTVRLIEREEPYEGYWERSEDEALSHAEKFIDRTEARILDVGCGEGRLFDRFEKYADGIIGIEPDKDRRNSAVKEAEVKETDIDISGRNFLEADFDQAFDIVLCSHVLQHVKTSDLDEFADRLRNNLVDGGLLILTTSHSAGRSDVFMKSYSEEGSLKEDEISERDFNSLVTNDENILPVHLFTIKNLEKLLEGFDFRAVRVFHELHSVTFLDSLMFRDKWVNLPFLKKRMGRDVLVVAEKK
jgi:SAM-dependent methyltransferase